MKILKYIALIITSFVVSCQQGVQPITHNEAASTSSAQSRPFPNKWVISKEEEQDLLKLVPQVLGWASLWNRQLQCPTENMQQNPAIDGLEWKRRYLSSVGHTLDSKIEVESEYRLNVYLFDLGIKIPLNRKDGKRLEALWPIPLCSNETDSAPNSIQLSIDISERSATQPTQPEKQSLLNEVESYTKSILCSKFSGSTDIGFQFFIPDFEVGDPSVYVVVNNVIRSDELKPTTEPDQIFVIWLNFIYDSNEGYRPEFVKQLGLSDEIDPIIDIARLRVLRESKILCQNSD